MSSKDASSENTSAGATAPPQAWVISFPKCGRTWLRLMICRVLSRHYGLTADDPFDTLSLTRRAGLLATECSHDGSGMQKGVPWRPEITDKSCYAQTRVCLLVRDPRDVMVSCYFQAVKRSRVYQGKIAQFLRDEHCGARRCVQFHQAWCRARTVPRQFLVLRYEDMRRDPAAALSQVLAMMGAENVPAATLQEAVEFARFENMRKLEAENALGSARLKPADVADPESYKVRRGVVGGFRDYLSKGDCAYLDRVIREGNCPLLAPYVVHTSPPMSLRWLRAAGKRILSLARHPQRKTG